ncbi:MAG: hypothetical protein JHC20_04765 [Pyrobaculum sp.]|nr:hypothetical protein [Pyrobaculum sp.]
MVDIEKVLRLLGLKIDELTTCDIYINYFMQYIADIEREIYNIKSKISYLEERCFTNIKEINK